MINNLRFYLIFSILVEFHIYKKTSTPNQVVVHFNFHRLMVCITLYRSSLFCLYVCTKIGKNQGSFGDFEIMFPTCNQHFMKSTFKRNEDILSIHLLLIFSKSLSNWIFHNFHKIVMILASIGTKRIYSVNRMYFRSVCSQALVSCLSSCPFLSTVLQ